VKAIIRKGGALLKSIVKILSFSILSFFFCWSAWSDDRLAMPEGRVILEIKGKIEYLNTAGAAQFDAGMLAALPQQVVKTTTPWTDGIGEFSGPRLLDLLAAVGSQNGRLTFVALNDYRIEIPFADLRFYPVILATHLNGKRLRVRDRGPLWVIYPWSDFAKLQTETYYRRSIWQVHKITVE